MKPILFMAISIILSLGVSSCTKKQPASQTSESKDSITSPITNNTSQGVEILDKTSIIVKNEGKYPSEVKIFEDKPFSERIKNITGSEYDAIIKNFNVETPIVSENGIYKFSGCKQHDCPSFQTTIYYDAKTDNINVIISKNDKVSEFAEKGKIEISETLKKK
ncbi:MAG: hypothetical protein QM653_12435 [Dysgonomonas sp.]|uniref:hypothetical protein n=1 Tax=Dysgonomonas sp. TaxID=1891233 RepID=UPI0039E508FA